MCKMRIADGSIVREWFKPRAIVPVDFDEMSISSSNAEELMIISDVNVIPSINLISITDVGIESIVGTIILIHISILFIDRKCYVEVIIRETEIRSD